MKTLIVYASKYGSTTEAANRLARLMGGDTQLCNLNEVQTAPEGYDAVILGGPVFVGKMPAQLLQYCARHQDALLTKKLGVFACCSLQSPQHQQFMNENLPQPILQAALANESFGGEIPFDKVNFVVRGMLKAITKKLEAPPSLDDAAIQRMAKAFAG